MRRVKQHGFSLIEILVTISLMALLIALLLPVLVRARDNVDDIQCQTNVANLMKAQLNYSLDNDNYYIHYNEWVWNRNSLSDKAKGKPVPSMAPPGFNVNAGFIRYANDYTNEMAVYYGEINHYVSNFEAHFCPTAPEMPVNGLKGGHAPLGEEVIRSYVQNSNIAVDSKYPNVESVSRPDELMMLTEENTFIMNFRGMPGFRQHFGPHPMNDAKLDLVWDSIGSMHRRKDSENLRSGYASGGFIDGHVEWVFSQAMSPSSNNTNATAAFADLDHENPEDIEDRFVDDSSDYSFTY